MQVNQKLSILFYRKTKKMDKAGYVPIYVRVTIDGLSDEISTSVKVPADKWDSKSKIVTPHCPDHKELNKRLGHIKTDLERHCDLVIAQNGLATPALVFKSYKSPINGHQEKNYRKESILFSMDVDEVVGNYIKYNRAVETLDKLKYIPPIRLEKLEDEKRTVKKQIEDLVKCAYAIFNDKNWTKTLMLAINEHVLNFLQMVFAGDRAVNTLRKKLCTKKTIQEFINRFYEKDDIDLHFLEPKFMTEFVRDQRLIQKNEQNTIWKYTQIIKEAIDRCVTNGWISRNIFANFESQYVEPDGKVWPSMEEMEIIINTAIKDEPLSTIRWIFVYQSFSGCAVAELAALDESHLTKGIDQKIWADQNRKKTESKETLPLLPICLEIIEMFRNHPRCKKSGRLLPVPSYTHYNSQLKVLGKLIGIPTLNNSHQARYFFANELCYEMGLDDITIASLLGQTDPASVKTYVKPTLRKISKVMSMMEERLYENDGILSKRNERRNAVGPVIIPLDNISTIKKTSPVKSVAENKLPNQDDISMENSVRKSGAGAKVITLYNGITLTEGS